MTVLQIVNLMIIARLLTPEEIGVFVVAVSVMTMVQALREMGLSNYLIRDEELRDETIRAVFGMSIALCIVLAGGLILSRHSIAEWMNAPEISGVLLLVSLTILVFPIEQTASALLRRDMRFDVLARVALSARLTGIVTSIVLAFMGLSTMALVWGLIAEVGLRVSLLCRAEARHLRLGPTWHGWRPLMGFGVWTTGASLAGQAAVEGNKLLVGIFLGAAPVAIFDRAARIPGMVRKGIFGPLSGVMFPAFAKDLREGRDIGPKVIRLTTITTGIVWPTFAAIALLSDEVVLLLLGTQWTETAVILPWLLIAQSLLSLLPQPEQILVPYGHVRRLMILRMVQLAVSLTIAVISLQWGLEVFAMARFLNALIFTFASWVAISPYMGVSLGALARGHAQSMLAMIAIAVPVAAWKFGLIGGAYPTLAALLVLGMTLGLGAMMLVNHPLAEEMIRTFRWLRNRRQPT
jgi:O-antigen/teichoic acid export membrane protein